MTKTIILNIKYIIFFVAILYSPFSKSQNLVINPSFEEYNTCPNALANYNEFVSKWSTPTQSSPDYFNGCSKKMNIPKTYQGMQASIFGNGFSGIHTYIPNGTPDVINGYREYIIGMLSETLEKGKEYKVSFYINLSDKSKYAIKSIDIMFSEENYYSKINTEISYFSKNKKEKHLKFKILNIENNNFYTDKENWIQLSQNFIATGFENFIIIGNFNDNLLTESTVIKEYFLKEMAYYYIDMVAVKLVENEDINSTRSRPEQKKAIILE